MDIERSNNRTEVIVDEGINTVSYALDEQLIEALTLIQVRTCVCMCAFVFGDAGARGYLCVWVWVPLCVPPCASICAHYEHTRAPLPAVWRGHGGAEL